MESGSTERGGGGLVVFTRIRPIYVCGIAFRTSTNIVDEENYILKIFIHSDQANTFPRYGFLGPNGQGKTTLVRHIAKRELPVPLDWDILLVEQEAKVEGN